MKPLWKMPRKTEIFRYIGHHRSPVYIDMGESTSCLDDLSISGIESIEKRDYSDAQHVSLRLTQSTA